MKCISRFISTEGSSQSLFNINTGRLYCFKVGEVKSNCCFAAESQGDEISQKTREESSASKINNTASNDNHIVPACAPTAVLQEFGIRGTSLFFLLQQVPDFKISAFYSVS